MYNHCLKWNVTVNTFKNVVMLCKLGGKHENFDVYYGNTKLKIVNRFCYLSIIFSSNGNFFNTQKSLIKLYVLFLVLM